MVNGFKILRNKKIIIGSLLIFGFLLVLANYLHINFFKGNLDATNSIATAKSAFVSGDFDRARKEFENGLKYDSKNPEILSGLITSIASQGNQRGQEKEYQLQAKPFVEKALKVASSNSEVLNAVGYVSETAGDYQEALKYYEKAINLDETCAQCWFHKGHVLLFLGNREEAKQAFEKAYELDPNNAMVLIEKGRIKVNEKDLDGAFQFFIEAAESAPASNLKADALTSASAVKRNLGYVIESLELSKKAYALDNLSVQVVSNHGLNLAISGQAQEGVNLLFEATKLNTRSVQPYWFMGMVLRADKNFKEAIDYLEKGIAKVDSDNTILGESERRAMKGQLIYDLAKTHSMAGNDTEALNFLKQAAEISPTVKTVLALDLKNGFFKSIENSADFQALLK